MYVWMTKPGGSRVWVPASSSAHWEALGFRTESAVETFDDPDPGVLVETFDDADQDMSTPVDANARDDSDYDADR